MNKIKKIENFLKNEGTELFKGAHDIYTPLKLVSEVITRLELKNKRILVLFNVEFCIDLVYNKKVKPSQITFYSDNNNKSELLKRFGIKKILTIMPKTKFDFDVVLINPPYQKGNEGVWKKFCKIALDLAPVVGFITPRNIVNGENTQKGSGKNSFFNKIKHGLTYIDFSADKHFKVGKKICAWIYDQSTINTNKKCIVITNNETNLSIDIRSKNYIPYNFDNELDYSIFEKISKFNTMSEFKMYQTRQSITTPHLVTPCVKHLGLKYVKVVKNLSAEKSLGKDCLGYQLHKNELAGCQDYLNSDIFKYIFNLYGGSDVRAGMFRKFPKIDFTKRYNNASLNKLFDLNKKEILYITKNDV
jgi:hypothetical protein